MTPTRDDAPPMDVAAPFAGSVDFCQKPGCDQPLPIPHHVTRKYCDEHQPNSSKKTGKVKKDKSPPNVVIDMGVGKQTSKGDKELAAVEAKAAQIASVLAALVLMAGQPEDAEDITKATPQWSKSVRELAEHEAWLRKIATGGETSARAMAWITFAVATVSMVLPILLRHKALPENISTMAATFLGVSESMVGDAAGAGVDEKTG